MTVSFSTLTDLYDFILPHTAFLCVVLGLAKYLLSNSNTKGVATKIIIR